MLGAPAIMLGAPSNTRELVGLNGDYTKKGMLV